MLQSVEGNFVEKCLKAHNKYRASHGVPSLVLSEKLCAISQEWAKKIASIGFIEHRPDSFYGENIYCVRNPDPDFTVKGRDPVESWYKEIEGYTFGEEPNVMQSAHFTQLVWKSCKKLGVGIAKSKKTGYIFVVANYSPRGNFLGDFADNVPPVGGFTDEEKPKRKAGKESKQEIELVGSSEESEESEANWESVSEEASEASDAGDTDEASEASDVEVKASEASKAEEASKASKASEAKEASEASKASKASKAKEASEASKGSEGGTDFEREGLKAHNEYRKKHGVPLLKVNPELTKYAQEWADFLASNNLCQYRQNGKYGESMITMSSTVSDFPVSAKEVSESWYANIKNFEFGREPTSLQAAHFTAMIWKNTTEFGMALGRSGNRAAVVANYNRRGNYIGQFVENVPRPINTASEAEKPKPQEEQDDSSSSSEAAESSDCGNDFERVGLKSHNDYRRRHGCPPLKINPALTRYAQEWADNLASRNSMYHRTNGKYGENLYSKWSSDSNFSFSAKDACDSWYAEIKDFYFGYEPTTLKAGHFTAMIWKNTTELGMAMARSGNKVYMVANYNPWGNYSGQYTANCPRPIEFSSQEKPKKSVAKQPTQQAAQSSSNDNSGYGSAFEKEGLRIHNEYRRRHGVPMMTLSPTLCSYAQEWANNLAYSNSFHHRSNGKYGENLYAWPGYNPSTAAASPKEACDLWYAEIKDYHFGYEPATLVAGHFTAMIWRGSTELGIAWAASGSRIVIVANYNPWGNVTGQYRANCPPPL